MFDQLNQSVDKYRENIIKSTQDLVSIKSVESDAQEGKPFGQGVDKSLKETLKLAEKLGFETKDVDGYAGHAEIGEGEEIMGILCHLDVVPEGVDWTYPPYEAEIHDGKIYGRGVLDDKGPAVAALYAMKAVQESDIELNKRVRIIFGTDEETGWEGLDYYLEREETPDFAFTPDAEFPVIHAEKGIMIFDLETEFNNISSDGDVKLISVEGGNAPNMVPDYCEAVLKVDDEQSFKDSLNEFINKTDYKIDMKKENDQVVLESHGISAHGSMPQDGQNAVSQLMMFLADLNLPEDDIKEFLDFYKAKIGMEYNGQSIGCGFSDEVSGKLIFNVGLLELDQNQAKIVVNIRYPVTNDLDKVTEGIKKDIKNDNINYKLTTHKEPLYVEKDDPLVKNLMDVYRDITGDEDSEPIAIGGGTYARAIEKAVAFGPLFPGQPELAHQKDENMAVDDLVKNSKIYANAIAALASDK